MTSNYRVVRYSPEHKAAVLRLQTHLWGADIDVNRAYLDWKYASNPYAVEPNIYLVLCGDEVVGMRGFIGTKWEIGAAPRRHRIACGADTVISPEHRGRFLFEQIMKFAERDLHARGQDYLLNLCPGPIIQRLSLLSGWRIFADCQPFERCQIEAKPDHGAFERLGVDANHIRGADGAVTAAREPAAAEMAALIDRLGHGGRIRHVRDRSYFDWRFKNPLNQYRLLYWRDPALRGYLVLRANPSQTDAIYIVDWEAENEDVADGLLAAAVGACGGARIRAWTGTIAPVRVERLKASDFAPGPERYQHPEYRQSLMIKLIDTEQKTERWCLDGYSLLDEASWDIRMLYWDGV